MKKLVLTIICIISLCVSFGCQAQQNVKTIDGKTVHQMIADQQQFVLVDVREENEYNEGHIPHSELIPLGTIDVDFETKVPSKETKIIVYCRTGRRSHEACLKIMKLGYQNVYDLVGIQDWEYEIE